MEDFISGSEPNASRWGELYIGIDPGITGGIAMIARANLNSSSSHVVLLADAPVVRIKKTRHEMDVPAMVGILQRAKEWCDDPFACIEWAQSMPKQGVAGVFSYGMGFGMWLGVLSALEIPFVKVRPQEWKKEMLRGHDYKEGKKNTSILVASNMFPGVDLGERSDAGRAEALLVAAYGMRTHWGLLGREGVTA